MPIYDFKCTECGQKYEMDIPMSADTSKTDAKCLKCKKPLKRVYGCPAIVIKGTLNQVIGNLSSNQTMINCDGRPIRLNFIDHGPRAELADRSIGHMMQGARMDEKTGRMVVDVVSNVPDPLGKIDQSKKNGKTKTTVKHVNTPVKVR